MYIAYVDESGDAGHNTSVTRRFVLSGIIVAHLNWRSLFDRMKAFRQGLRRDFGVRLRADLRGTDLWRAKGDFKGLGLSYTDRLRVFRRTAELLRYSGEVTVLTVSIDKAQVQPTAHIGEIAWTLFLQRYENWLLSNQGLGIVVNDEGHDKLVRQLLRRMRVYNPIASRYGGYYQAPLLSIIEDPFSRNSRHSYFIQLADMSAYLARLRHDHASRQAKWGLHRLYKRIRPRYLLQASRKDNYGFVTYP